MYNHKYDNKILLTKSIHKGIILSTNKIEMGRDMNNKDGMLNIMIYTREKEDFQQEYT